MEQASTPPPPATVEDKSPLLKKLVATQRYYKYVEHKSRLIYALWDCYDRLVLSAPPERFFKSFGETVKRYEEYSSQEIQTEIWQMEKLIFQHRDQVTAFESGRSVYGLIR